MLQTRHDAPVAAAPFQLERVDTESATTLRLAGNVTLENARELWEQTRVDAQNAKGKVTIDLTGVERLDGGALALLVHLKSELEARGVAAELVASDGTMRDLVHLYHGDSPLERRRRRRPEGTLSQIGRSTLGVILELKRVLSFVGELTREVGGLVKAPTTANWKALMPTMERTGADAVPIVVLIIFLIGFVTAFQAAAQLKQFGANIFAADLVGLAITRELGPLMTAIIVSGRSGAAFAAELGTMRVSEEVDALSVLGLGPLRYLVVPRVLGLMLVMPLLTLLADVVGAAGGLVVGITSLDLSVVAYLHRTSSAVHIWDVCSGLLKSMVFGLAIGLIGCQQGLATSGGAEGVGRATTAAVVTTLFSLILIDAAFTVAFYVFGL